MISQTNTHIGIPCANASVTLFCPQCVRNHPVTWKKRKLSNSCMLLGLWHWRDDSRGPVEETMAKEDRFLTVWSFLRIPVVWRHRERRGIISEMIISYTVHTAKQCCSYMDAAYERVVKLEEHVYKHPYVFILWPPEASKWDLKEYEIRNDVRTATVFHTGNIISLFTYVDKGIPSVALQGLIEESMKFTAIFRGFDFLLFGHRGQACGVTEAWRY